MLLLGGVEGMLELMMVVVVGEGEGGWWIGRVVLDVVVDDAVDDVVGCGCGVDDVVVEEDT